MPQFGATLPSRRLSRAAHVKMLNCSRARPPCFGAPSQPKKTAAKLALTGSLMDIERINTIGTTLADLTARTDALRGYL